jgi:hypothetical protein
MKQNTKQKRKRLMNQFLKGDVPVQEKHSAMTKTQKLGKNILKEKEALQKKKEYIRTRLKVRDFLQEQEMKL